MSYVDILILIFLAFGAVLGFKRGFTRELVSFIGLIVIIVLSFLLKNPVSVILYNNLPFFNFGGIFKDITVLNILLYETIAFLVVFMVLLIVYRILLSITKVFEKILNITIILGIPSKILGAILGILENAVIVFIVMYVFSLPIFNFSFVKQTKIGNDILNNTPILTNICDKTLTTFNEIIELKDEYLETNNFDDYNQKVVEKMIENKIITKENVIKLIDKGKIKGVKI